MKFLSFLMLLNALFFVSCSSKKKKEDVSEETAGLELSKDDELIDDAALLDSDDKMVDDIAMTDQDLFGEDQKPVEPVVSEAPAQAVVSAPVSSGGQMEKSYTVQKNETLMLIAFKLYGDYARWRELAQHNSGTLSGSSSISEGMVLKYMSDGQDFVWNPEGEPYLIKRGDTLGLISNTVYGTPNKWKSIWDNNRPLIKDPNIIFAGFTIYYLMADGRDVANQ